MRKLSLLGTNTRTVLALNILNHTRFGCHISNLGDHPPHNEEIHIKSKRTLAMKIPMWISSSTLLRKKRIHSIKKDPQKSKEKRVDEVKGLRVSTEAEDRMSVLTMMAWVLIEANNVNGEILGWRWRGGSAVGVKGGRWNGLIWVVVAKVVPEDGWWK